ncbi:hypothetical protein C2845_PM02G07210 [Panicum miliaceum]|uniref:Uncharacterized protein n=1 Tax=Panicum miliaceum TaxID=4540 RepID=A0A3L6SG09_PANMI|nr:hypothetical protein C2845_PM02G07210 [Panicum miliaceum]
MVTATSRMITPNLLEAHNSLKPEAVQPDALKIPFTTFSALQPHEPSMYGGEEPTGRTTTRRGEANPSGTCAELIGRRAMEARRNMLWGVEEK